MTISEQPLHTIASKLRQGELRAEQLLDAAQERYQARADVLNAYKTWTPEFARQQAQAADTAFAAGADLGPMQGIPVSVKDHYGVQGLPIFAGTAQALPDKWQQEGPVVTTLRQQLATITGKTHAVELAFGGIGLNNHWGTPRNPWDKDHHRVPGGSSCGAGVSLWQGSAFLALGTDTGGSVRIPASMTGTVGLKTSFGRWSLEGIVPLSPSLDTAGILARSVVDVSFGFAAIDPAWHNPLDLSKCLQGLEPATLRIGLADTVMWENCQADIVRVVKEALAELEAKGAQLIDTPLPEAADAIELLRSGSVVSAECDAFLEAELPDWRPLLDPIITMRIADGGAIPARDYVLRQQRIAALSRSAATRFSGIDVIASPTLPLTPPRLDEVSDLEGYRPRNGAALSNTCVGNFLNLCGISLPVGLDTAGMPVGLQLLAPHGQEEKLLAVATAVERVLGNPQQRLGRPPLCP